MTDKEKESLQRWLQAYWKDAIYAKKNAIELQTFEAEKDFVWIYGLAAGFRLCCYSVLGLPDDVRLLDAMKEVDGWTKEVEEKYGMVL
ncbi:MAG: hypothetical protein MR395_08825 [Caecibacter massiliensis]|nr:hypothetical protein [Caecibacter massiliensis]